VNCSSASVVCTTHQLPHPAHSPNLSPSDCHLFGLVKDALHGCHFAGDNELKQSFNDVLQSQGREFYSTGIQCLTQRWKKCEEKMETLWKNSFIIAKDVWIIHIKFIVISIILPEKNFHTASHTANCPCGKHSYLKSVSTFLNTDFKYYWLW
jgi:hypothetical protein